MCSCTDTDIDHNTVLLTTQPGFFKVKSEKIREAKLKAEVEGFLKNFHFSRKNCDFPSHMNVNTSFEVHFLVL